MAVATMPVEAWGERLEMGDIVYIDLIPDISTYKHKLTYTFGNLSGKIPPSGDYIKTYVGWQTNINFANQTPKATSAKATITCKTYDKNNKLIGTKSNDLFPLHVPATVVPTVDSVEITEQNPVVTQAFGDVVVGGLSQLKVEIFGSGAYGSTISGYEIWYNAVGSGSGGPVLAPVKSRIFDIENTYTRFAITPYVKDSRGRLSPFYATVSKTPYPYSPPSITNLIAEKCDPNGTLNPQGTSTKVTVMGGYSTVNNLNTQSLVVKYKKTSDTNFTPVSISLSGKGESWMVTKIINGTLPDITYEFVAELTDKIQTTSKTLKSGIVAISRLAGGKGIRFFKEAEKEGFWVEDVDYTISTEDFNAISDNLGGIPDMSLANALKKMTEAVDVPLTWKSGWGGTYTCKAYPAQRICRLTGTVATGHPVLEPSTYVTVANIPSAYLPTEVYALTASGGTQVVEGAVGSLGVRLRAKGGNWTAGYVGYFSGWWYY